MSSFYRNAHSRTNRHGNTFWVNGHTVSRDQGHNSVGNIRHQLIQFNKPLNLSDIKSYTIPNARCPVCKEEVFFYRSPNGGSVFFDELGPPWPKHPCTISNAQTITTISSSSNTSKRYEWQTNQWIPCLNISLKKIESVLFEIELTINNHREEYYFKSYINKLHSESTPLIVYMLPIDSSKIKINFWTEKRGEVEVFAYKSKDEARKEKK